MKQIQEQTQKQVQQQRLTQQQMMLVRMLEMPLAELEQNVMTELDDNPALVNDNVDDNDNVNGNGNENGNENENLDDNFNPDGNGEDYDNWDGGESRGGQWSQEQEQMVYGEQTSFYDTLKEQMGELELSEEQQTVMDYLIGSLDNDGLLRKSLDTIADELAVYHNTDVGEDVVVQMLEMLQDFDPAGIGARSLQECLLLQLNRKRWTEARARAVTVLEEHYEDFLNKRWDRIRTALSMSEEETMATRKELLRLNPKPGASLGETEGRSTQQITPDFIVDTADDGRVTFSINRGRVPDLYVSDTFTSLLNSYRQRAEKGALTRSEKEAVVYAKEKVERARNYIEAVRQRRHTLYVTMKAIIDIQHRYFEEGDESDLKPMILKDVADRTGLDISTVSRVSNMKYAQTRWGTFKLRHFFSDGYRTESGEEMSTRKIKVALKDIIDHEDKRKPLSDDTLKEELAKRGLPIARRTISKYRDQLGIPVARLRAKR